MLRFAGVIGFRGVTVGQAACGKDSVGWIGVNHNREHKYLMGDLSRG